MCPRKTTKNRITLMHSLGDISLSKASLWVGPLILGFFFDKPRKSLHRSLIIMGPDADSHSHQDLSQKLSLLMQVMGIPVTISGIRPILSRPSIFRAKIPNDDVRKQVLDKYNILRDTAYNTVYISCDLNYFQRAEMFALRQDGYLYLPLWA